MNRNLKLVVNNFDKKLENKYFFEKDELNTILDLYANRQVGFRVFKNAAENAMYKICKNLKPSNKNLKYLITDLNGKVLKNSSNLEILIKNTNWKKL